MQIFLNLSKEKSLRANVMPVDNVILLPKMSYWLIFLFQVMSRCSVFILFFYPTIKITGRSHCGLCFPWEHFGAQLWVGTVSLRSCVHVFVHLTSGFLPAMHYCCCPFTACNAAEWIQGRIRSVTQLWGKESFIAEWNRLRQKLKFEESWGLQ